MKEQIIKAIKSMEEETLLEVLYRSALCPEELGMSDIDQCGGRGCKTCWKQSKIIKTLDEKETAQEGPVQEQPKSIKEKQIEILQRAQEKCLNQGLFETVVLIAKVLVDIDSTLQVP